MTLRKLNMEINFKFASEIIRIFNSDSIEDNMNALTFLDYSSVEEFILIILKNGTNCIIKPQKYSLLHHFIEGYLYCYLSHERYYLLDSLCDDLDKEMLFDFFDTQYDLIRNYDNHNFCYEEEIEALDVAYENSGYDNHKEYKDGLRTLYDTYEEEFTKFIPKIVESVFYILYGNKKLLFNFNNYISSFVSEEYLSHDMFNDYNHIVRVKALPEWLKRAIYYRDRGRCQYCNRDISGLYSILEDKEKHFDHIIPLEKGGTNDATNLQLTCSECNLSKNSDLKRTDNYYEVYW